MNKYIMAWSDQQKSPRQNIQMVRDKRIFLGPGTKDVGSTYWGKLMSEMDGSSNLPWWF